MTPTEITAHALALGITKEAFPEFWGVHCTACDRRWGRYVVACPTCAKQGPLENRCYLPSPDSDDPRCPLWDGFYMRALGWPNLGDYGEFYECLVACGDMMLSSHRGPTPTAALRAAWLAKGASK
jgi:hypothetical protein